MLPTEFYENLDPSYYRDVDEATYGNDASYFYWPEEDYLVPESWVKDVHGDVYF